MANAEPKGIRFNAKRRRLMGGVLAAGLGAPFAAELEGHNRADLPAPAIAIRTITAGVTLSPQHYRAELLVAREFLMAAKGFMETAGFIVQTVRITTQASEDLFAQLEQSHSLAMIADMKAVVGEDVLLSMGPASTGNQPGAPVRDRCLHAARHQVSSTLSIGDRKSGIHHDAIEVAAQVVEHLAARDPMQNFAFAAIANVKSGIPFFPAGYHDGGAMSFAIGTEGASLFKSVCAEIQNLATVEDPLVNAYTRELTRVEALAQTIAGETGVRYAGIDTTPAQWGENSIGAAVESLIHAPFGSPGTLAACQIFTKVIKSIPVRRTGYQGLFLPPLEDSVLAARAYDHYGLSSLLSYSAVCGTGLDAVAIPGDTTRAELARILTDVASLAIRLDKPLTARLFPVPGKHAGESTGPLGDLFPMKVLGVR